MAKKPLVFIGTQATGQPPNPHAFRQNFQTALLLSLLDRGLISAWKYELVAERTNAECT